MDWTSILTLPFIIQILATSISYGMATISVAIGETFAERSGVFNLSIEGVMLFGGFAALSTTFFTGNHWLGILASLLVGAIMGLPFAFASISLGAHQVVTGFAMLMFTNGCAYYFNRLLYSSSPLPQIQPFVNFPIPVLSEIPIIGPVLFNHDVLTYILMILVPISYLVLYRTRFGLRITAVGEYPAAADTVGISVAFARYLSIVIGTALAGLGGAQLALSELGTYSDSMTGGRGFIAMGLVILGGWNPFLVFGGGILFGIVDALQVRFQFLGSIIPSEFMRMFPYILTVVALLVWRKRRAPSAMCTHYSRE